MPLDQFIFHRMRETETNLSVDIEVELMGPFDREFRPAELAELTHLGAPVGTSPKHAPQVLNWYEFMEDSPEPVRDLTIKNEFFKESGMRIGQGMGLLVPAGVGTGDCKKGRLDSYKLYRVVQGEEPEDESLTMGEGMVEKVEIGPPMLFGTPIALRHQDQECAVSNTRNDLVLYRLPPALQNSPMRTVDRFGAYEYDLRRRKFLAVPSLKLIVNGTRI